MTQIKPRILLFILLAALLLASGAAAAQVMKQAPIFTREVVSSGYTSTTVGSVTLNGTLGQPFVGISSSGNVDLGHGFWHGGKVGSTIYLPVVRKE